jgi:23S rRNA (adenine2503-C2)-methyltransferase
MSREDLDLPGITNPGATRRDRPQKAPTHWADLALPDRPAAVQAAGLPGFRADQISRHYFGQSSADPSTWTDMSAAMRAEVAAEWFPELLSEVTTVSCDAGATAKSVWRLSGGALVESVVMAYRDRVTACVSSQAGCGIGCPFCATGQQGLTRNLTCAEIVEQVRRARLAAESGHLGSGRRLSNIVFMGMGEPMANYNAVVAALHRIVDPAPAGFGMSARGVTVSTVGLVPRVRQLAREGLPVTLAVSLHAPDDELRDELVPINHRWPVAEVIAVADEYADVTGRRYSIEYALIRDVNDQAWRADALAQLLAGRLVHVNLIPLNPTPGSVWTAATPEVQDEFVRRLRAGRISVTVRDTRGQEIDGACGQLAAVATE